MGAAQDRPVRHATDPAGQRRHVTGNLRRQRLPRGPGLDHPRQVGAGLGEHGHVLAALVDLDLVDPAGGGAGGGEHPHHVQLLHLLPPAVRLVLPGQAGSRLDGGHDDAEDVQGPPQVTAQARQPGLLQAAQGNGGRGVAGQDHQARPLREQAGAGGAGQVHHLLPRSSAIGGVGLVAVIDEVGGGQALHQRPVHAQAADAGIEDTEAHGTSTTLPTWDPDSSQAWAFAASARGKLRSTMVRT